MTDNDNYSSYKIDIPEFSDWKCYLFGNKPDGNGLVYIPLKGNVPNFIVRWFMKVCLGCTWRKIE